MRQMLPHRTATASRAFWMPFFAATMGASLIPAQAQAPNTVTTQWNFEDGQAGAAPAGFTFARTGMGRPGQWMLKRETDAPSGTRVLAQMDTDTTDVRFPIAVASGPRLADFRLSVKCKPVSGTVDQACGLVFRYQNENNYYVARANALEGNVNLYHVVRGHRRQWAGWDGAVTGNTWHELRVDAQADHVEVYWDGHKVIDAHDQTFRNAGQVGVWTKADSVTYFDDLSVEPLGP